VSAIHPAAAKGFARSAEEYERARPDYPAEALAFVASRLALGPGRTVLDLAAGTGKLTRPLAATGATVVAVEPVDEMRTALPDGLRAIAGTAEAIPLDIGTCDAVTVGQAFHWFDGQAALAEIHRVLRPGGGLALVWNRRRIADPVNQAIEELMAPHRQGTPAHRSGEWRAAFERTPLFGPLEEHLFENSQQLDADGLADWVGSISFIAALEPGVRGSLLAAVRSLAASGRVTVPYTTEVQVCRRR
jgi:ubiquinone/menaquinone biosynthesis C-methylase UbiE